MSLLKKSIKSICKKRMITIGPDASVEEAAIKLLKFEDIGSLIVKEKGKIIGIMTERDIVNRAIAKKKSPQTTKVRSIMTKKLLTVPHDATLPLAAHMMHKKNKKKLLVKEGAKIIGILTQTDIIRHCGK